MTSIKILNVARLRLLILLKSTNKIKDFNKIIYQSMLLILLKSTNKIKDFNKIIYQST